MCDARCSLVVQCCLKYFFCVQIVTISGRNFGRRNLEISTEFYNYFRIIHTIRREIKFLLSVLNVYKIHINVCRSLCYDDVEFATIIIIKAKKSDFLYSFTHWTIHTIYRTSDREICSGEFNNNNLRSVDFFFRFPFSFANIRLPNTFAHASILSHFEKKKNADLPRLSKKKINRKPYLGNFTSQSKSEVRRRAEFIYINNNNNNHHTRRMRDAVWQRWWSAGNYVAVLHSPSPKMRWDDDTKNKIQFWNWRWKKQKKNERTIDKPVDCLSPNS